MSESEGRKELGGLARSIDSLFSAADESEDSTSDEEAPPGGLTHEGEDPATPGASVAPSDGDAVPEEEVTGDPDDGSLEARIAAADAELAQVEAQIASVESEVSSDGADGDPVGDHDGAGDRDVPAESRRSGPEQDTQDAEAHRTDAEPAVDATPPPEEDPHEPGPLAAAVASFLAGEEDAGPVRTLATEHLGRREYDPVAEAVERLVHQFAERGDPDVMEVASELLTPIVRSRVVQRLGRERDEGRRQVYHDICRALGEDMALAIRDELAETGDRFSRRAYFDALIAMGESSRPVIQAMAEDENRFLARNAVAILGEIGGPRAVELVVGALANTDPRVRREALMAMARLKVENADEFIVGRIEDDTEPSVRLAAIVTAGELRVERAVRPLVAALEGAYETDEVLPLLHALGQIGDPGAVPAIEKHAVRELFAKPRTEVRIAAYQALNHIGTPHARRLLNQAVSDKDAEVKAAVKELLHMR